MALRDICQAIDQIAEPPITTAKLIELGLEEKQLRPAVQALTQHGLLRCTNPGGRPFQYAKAVDSLTAELEAGRLKGLFGGRSTKRKEQPPEEIVFAEEIELDPREILEQLDAQDFAQLIGAFIAQKAGESGPLKEQLEKAQQDIRYAEGQRVNSERVYQSRINELNEQLRDAREQVLNLRAEINTEKSGRVMREQSPKIVLQRANGLGQMEHGGSGIPLGSRGHAGAVMHKKPHVNHPPAVVVYKKKKG